MLYRVFLTVTLLFSAGFFAPQAALGSCGDWLAHPVTSEDDHAEASDHFAAQVPDSFPKRPCDGPGCRQAPAAPASAPSASTTDWRRIDLIGCRIDSVVVTRFYERCYRNDVFDLAKGHDLGIYRPPQS